MEKSKINIQKLVQQVLARNPESKGIQYMVEDKDFNLVFEGTAKDVTQQVNSFSQEVTLISFDSSISLRDLIVKEGQLIIAIIDSNFSALSILNFQEMFIDNSNLIFSNND